MIRHVIGLRVDENGVVNMQFIENVPPGERVYGTLHISPDGWEFVDCDEELMTALRSVESREE